MTAKPSVLITGASSGIGATYADRFARRGHDLVLVARDGARLEKLAARLKGAFGVEVDVVVADLTRTEDLERVEARLRDDARIGVLVNNAGAALSGRFVDQTTAQITDLVALNTTALVRLSSAVAPRMVAQESGAIVNIGSVVGLAPEFASTVYGATKAFVLFLSQGLALELNPSGVYVQAVLPAGTKTEIWERAGMDPTRFPPMMETEDLVDAALVGFDRKEPVTIPPLADDAAWKAYDGARRVVLGGLRQDQVAERYRSV